MAGPEPGPGRPWSGYYHQPAAGIPWRPVARWHRWTATGLGASMWFFLFYRFKQDGAVLLGLRHPWDH